MKVEALQKSEQAQKAKDRESYEKFFAECMEKKAKPAALEALAVLEAMEPGNPEGKAKAEQAGALGAPSPEAIGWGRTNGKKLAQQSAASWRDLVKEAQKQGVPHAAARFAGILLLFDPADVPARTLLGLVKGKDNKWLPKFDSEKAKLKVFFDPAWGYVSEEAKKNLEAGKRYRKGKWVPLEEEKRAPRSWEDRVLFNDPNVTVFSNLPYDEGLSYSMESRKFALALDDLFGDFFAPDPARSPAMVFVCRTQADCDEAGSARSGISIAGWETVCRFDRFKHAVVANAAADPKADGENFTLLDHVRAALVEWCLEETIGDRDLLDAPNFWIELGLPELARGRALLDPGPKEPLGWSKEYREARKSLPAVSDLLSMSHKSKNGPNLFPQAAALCHFLLHGEGGAWRLKFLGVVREYLLGRDPAAENLPKALGLTANEIETRLEAHMEGLFGK